MKNYFYQIFPNILRKYINRCEVRDCIHNNIPYHRAKLIWIPEPHQHEFRNTKFWYSWYILDLLDQNIHANFNNHYNRWVTGTNGYPIPMQEAGFGCIRRSRPNKLLDYAVQLSNVQLPDGFLHEAVDFFIAETRYKLPSMIGLDPELFLSALVQDREFNNPQNPFETLIIHQVMG